MYSIGLSNEYMCVFLYPLQRLTKKTQKNRDDSSSVDVVTDEITSSINQKSELPFQIDLNVYFTVYVNNPRETEKWEIYVTVEIGDPASQGTVDYSFPERSG